VVASTRLSSPPSSPEAAKEVRVEYLPWANTEKGVGQAYVHQSDAKFRLVMAGRQSGKTVVGISEICWDAMAVGGHINWWIAPNYKVAPRAWRGLLDFLPPEVIRKKNETEKYVVLLNGSEIWVKSADAPDSLVSTSLDFAVCDEAGQWKELAWFQGISPMFAARKDAKAMLIGTPRGKNWFHRLWLQGRGPDRDPDYEAFHWKSEDSPYVSRAFLEEQRRNIPLETYLQEYEADPLDNALAAFRNFRSAIRMSQAPTDGLMAVGVDLARKLDFSAMIGMNSSRQVTSVERFQDEWSEQKRRIVAKAFGLNARVVMDATGMGDVMVEEIRNAGVQIEGFIISNSSKANLIQNLQVAFQQGTISIPNDPVLIDELESYELEYDEETRKYKYAAPDGKHDDLVIALALALWGQRGAFAFASTQERNSYGGRGARETYGSRR
jgi:hypothetical protein